MNTVTGINCVLHIQTADVSPLIEVYLISIMVSDVKLFRFQGKLFQCPHAYVNIQ
jgi:hypothetical protein